MDILTFPYGLACANMYALRFGSEALVIDPCCPWAETKLSDIEVKAVFCTHGHFDHIAEAEDIVNRFHCPLYISKQDQSMLSDPYLNHAASFGINVSVNVPSEILTDNEVSSQMLGIQSDEPFLIKLVRTPGHTSGSVCFLFSFEDGKQIMFTGDMLFKQSIGRTDLGGSHSDMVESIKLLQTMDDGIVCYPGHGPSTDLGSEKNFNPFF